jgi:hypothetical protein
LRYSLRSIEKNLAGYGKVFIIGKLPEWIQNVEQIDIEDFPNHKQASLCNKMLAAARDSRVSENFIRWDDDHFLLKKLSVGDIGYWHRDNLTVWEQMARGYYRDVICRTKEETGDIGYFDVHTPIRIEKAGMEKLADIAEGKREVLVKTLYCFRSGITGEPYPEKDLKIDAPRVNWEIQRLIRDRIFFSVGEHGFNLSMRKILNGLYPDKSQYEK